MRTRISTILVIAVVGYAICALIASQLDSSLDVPYRKEKYSTDHYDYSGLIHFHTGFSGDAFGSYDDISKDAARQSIDFLISTEHNNLDATKQGQEGWHNNVLMLSGVESSRQEGYLLAFGIGDYTTAKKDKTESLIADVVRQQGVMIIAHPSRPKWRWKSLPDDRISGMEIVDLADLLYSASISQKLRTLILYPFNRAQAYLALVPDPPSLTTGWDAITRQRRFVGTYGPDFHQSLRLVRSIALHWPPASEVMRFARDHIVSATPFVGTLEADKAMVIDAIRRGHLYIGLDIMGDTTGFMFSASRGDERVWMGDELRQGGDAAFKVDLPVGATALTPTLHVMRNGEEIFSERWNAASPLLFSAGDPGAYRVEVRVRRPGFAAGGGEITWIYSNPIYVR